MPVDVRSLGALDDPLRRGCHSTVGERGGESLRVDRRSGDVHANQSARNSLAAPGCRPVPVDLVPTHLQRLEPAVRTRRPRAAESPGGDREPCGATPGRLGPGETQDDRGGRLSEPVALKAIAAGNPGGDECEPARRLRQRDLCAKRHGGRSCGVRAQRREGQADDGAGQHEEAHPSHAPSVASRGQAAVSDMFGLPEPSAPGDRGKSHLAQLVALLARSRHPSVSMFSIPCLQGSGSAPGGGWGCPVVGGVAGAGTVPRDAPASRTCQGRLRRVGPVGPAEAIL